MEVVFIIIGIWIGFCVLRGVFRYYTMPVVQGQSRQDANNARRVMEAVERNSRKP
jgi:hypothetical protein